MFYEIPHTVRVVLNDLVDVVPGVVIILKVVPRHQQLHLSVGPDTPPTQLLNLAPSCFDDFLLYDDRRVSKILVVKQ